MELAGYKFGQVIGEGGMATVFRGQQLSLSRPVAIKVLNQQLAKHSQVREAFERESLIIARLNHPNIIQVIDRGVTEENSPYFVMEYVDGVDLVTLIRQGQLPLARKISICLQICKALAYAHKNGVIHRDIKPGNVIVDRDYNVKVLDFGIAQFNPVEGEQGTAVMGGGSEQDVMGTLAYMAPELHHSFARANEKSDIYSLGRVMFELFAGFLPITIDKPLAHYGEEVSKPLDRLVMACVAEDVDRRPNSVQEVHDVLLQSLHGAHLDKAQVQRAQESVNQKSFRLLDVLRENEFGAVYLFREKTSGRQLIVKKHSGCFDGYTTGKRLAGLTHSNLVKVHGVSKNPRAFIVVMDYLPGGSLQERLVRPFPVNDFLPIARQVCAGLIYAHRNHTVHGNLRASNVLFDERGVAQITDFGLREHYSDDRRAPNGGDSVGRKKNWYSLPDEPVTVQKDVYACGVIFYQMLMGDLPNWHKGRLQAGRTFKRLPAELQAVLVRMLEPDPDKRFGAMAQVAASLDELSDNMATQVWPKALTVAEEAPVQPGKTRKLKVLWLLLLALAVLVAVNAGMLMVFGLDTDMGRLLLDW